MLLAAAPAPAQQLSPHRKLQAQQLLRTRLACLGCHTLDGVGGRVGPDLGAVGRRRSPEYIRSMIVDPQSRVPGTIMPRFVLSGGMLDLIVQYLAEARAAAESQVTLLARPTAPANASASERLYVQRCAMCHGTRGKSDGSNARYVGAPVTRHSDKRAMSARTDDRLWDAIYAGGYIMGGSGRMPPFGHTLTPDQIRGLVRYIRQLCDCEGPAWSRDGTRATP